MSFIRSFAFALSLSSVVAVPLVAAADPKPAPAPAEKKAPATAAKEVSPAEAEKFVGFFNKLIDIVVKDQDNCPAMAKDINGFVDANQDIIAAGNQAKADGKELPKSYKDKMEARITKEMLPALQKKCLQDKDVGAAMEKMARPPAKK